MDGRSDEGGAAGAPARSCAHEVHLLGGFQLRRDGHVIEIPPSSQRVVAFLALNDRSLPRSYVAASLWPDTTDDKASANLRTALWRLNGADHDVVDLAGSNVALHPAVWVDVRAVVAAATSYRQRGNVPRPELLDQVRGELLPGFWDSWLVFERERLRLELIRLYEVLAQDALRRGDRQLAALAALAAVECDPLREASNALLINAYLAGGDRTAARRAFRRYAALLGVELGVAPSPELCRLVPTGDTAVTVASVRSGHGSRQLRRGIVSSRRRRDVLPRRHQG